MVFYDVLPIEIWFVIYKYEHMMYLSKVNRQIRRIRYEVDIANHGAVEDFMEGGTITLWNCNEWLSFTNTVRNQKYTSN
jgi:hypothetical protein